MGIYTEAVQKLYVAYFSRPADPAGLAYWEGVVAADPTHSTAAVSAAFAGSQEYKDTYAGLNEILTVNAIYNNLFGRDAEPAGLLYWAAALQAKTITVDNMVATIAGAAQGTDAVAFANKVEVATAFTNAVGTTEEILAYNGTSANAAAKAFLATITDDASADAALVPAAMDAAVLAVTTPVPVDVNVSLTAGVDNIIGTANNESIAGSATTYTGLDKIDGGLGNDTLVLSDVAGASINLGLATVKGVESLQYTSTLGIGNAGVADISSWTGLTSATFALQGAIAQSITVANTTDLTVSNSGAAAISTLGGDDVIVTTGAAAVSVTGTALHTAMVTGGSTVAVSDLTKGTLTKATLSGNTGAATITGDKVVDVSLTNTTAAATISAAAATRTLNLALDKVTAGAAITDATATSIAITTANNASNIALSAAAVKDLTIAGDKALTIATLSAGALTSITASGSGDVTITPALGTGVAYTGTSAVDTITVGATTKAVATGLGNDVVTVSAGALGSGGTINAGDGSDTLAMTAADAATATGNGDFAAAISNFEKVSLTAAVANTTSTVNLANLDNINYVISAGTLDTGAPAAAIPAVAEKTELTITAAADGADTMTFEGTTVTFADGDTTAQIATKIAAATFTNYTVAAVGSVVTFTNKVAGVATDLVTGNFVFTNVDPAAVAAPVVAVTQQGSPGATATSEVQTVTITAASSTGAYQFLNTIVAGSQAGDTADVAATRIVTDKANLMTAWNAANPTREIVNITAVSNVLTITYKDTEGNVANLGATTSGGHTFGAGSEVTPGVVFSAAQNEKFTATLSGTSGGADTLTFEGETITFADGDNAATMAAKVVTQSGGAFTNYTVTANGAVLTFTNLANQDETDAVAGDFTMFNDTTNGVAAGTAAVTVAGANAVPGTRGVLALTNLASGGTLELTAAGSNVVGIKDASSGSSDVLNLVLKSTGGANFLDTTAASVETINITTMDTDGGAQQDGLTLVATGATKIVVSGNAGLALVNTGNTKVVNFDASGVTATGADGTVTFASANTTASAAVSIKGGAGNDTLTGNAGMDTIVGGAGDDTINGGLNNDVLTGGAGKDLFIQTDVSVSGVSYDTIMDLAKDDIVRVATITNADANTSAGGVQLGAALSGLDAGTAVFQDYLDAAANKGAGTVSWFTFLGNTYLVQDNNGGSPTFQNGVDNAIKLNGVVDLTNSTIVGTDLTIV